MKKRARKIASMLLTVSMTAAMGSTVFAEEAYETPELNIDYSQAVDPAGADVVNGTFSVTPEEASALATQMIGTQDQFKDMKIGFSQHRIAGSEWYEQLVDFAQAEADYLGIELTVYDANDDLNKQISDVETLINLGMNSMIVNPYNSANVGLDEILAADIPLTIVNQAVEFNGQYTLMWKIQVTNQDMNWLVIMTKKMAGRMKSEHSYYLRLHRKKNLILEDGEK